MTATKPTSSKPAEPTTNTEPDRIGLSATQLVASGLAAMSATVAASYFGVAGTMIGAALGSVVSVAGNAVYSYSLRRTRNRVRRTLDVAIAHRFAAEPSRVIARTEQAQDEVAAPRPRDHRLGLSLRPKRLALVAAGLFVAVVAITTCFELASGQPLSSPVTGKQGSGVSIGGGSSKQASPSRPVVPSPTGSSTGTGSASPGSSGATITVTVTPTGSASPTGSSVPATGSPAGSPAATGSPTGSPAASG